ncbi:MbnP family copper-binding protein [Truepera radiovictrix]|uniref:Copper-binding protein MbnP-like domain-containing protein n=1 Tax=Truepera radiovictrix (strain DSM 17093 / CIP 108686 / LMG 22925 / RQ-24) TaxID=649638 RepID=D7CUL5_TRURR|nr:MbnP family copper-binding protein [Truepera radiovictrix]ADI14006.1 conserved hypothetical protein [Truepera radiovictrix DSM 17093]WMT57434.1 metallo-mystery pair system four-Cys motif protein [Truepera radiovictrix]
MKTTAVLAALAAFALPLASAQDDVSPVTLTFDVRAGDERVSCGAPLPPLGSEATETELLDLRFYVSNVRLLSATGDEVPLELEQNAWQHGPVALLDFEDGSGSCEGGTAETNTQVMGRAPAGDYIGVAFTLGVPFTLNHLDVTTAPSPLNLSALWWNWQAGYKFARIDLQTASSPEATGGGEHAATPESDPEDTEGHAAPREGFWPLHLGSTGCASPSSVVPPNAECERPNRVEVRLELDPMRDTIVADLARLYEGVDLSQSLELAPPGCMSGHDDPDCEVVFTNLGLDLQSGSSEPGASFFRVARAQ